MLRTPISEGEGHQSSKVKDTNLRRWRTPIFES